MASFSGLRIEHERRPGARAGGDWTHFDALHAADYLWPEWLADWQSQTQPPLKPIGETYYDHWLLLMDGGGCVYALLMDRELYLLADSGVEALEALLVGPVHLRKL